MQNLNVNEELSSDEEDFVYGLDAEDVERYGFKYAKYKARIKKEEEGYDSSISHDSNSSDVNETCGSGEMDEFDNDCGD